MKLGFLASHNGSNMQAIIEACKTGALLATPSVVISNNADSAALVRAKRESIPYYHLSSITHPNQELLDQAILNALLTHEVDIVILAGYMKRLGEQTLARFEGAILNIHPALLPKFGGQGMYGIHVHEAVLAANEKETGVTVHLVTEEYDSGAIIAQEKVPVLPNDTATSLQQRVLKTEHALFTKVLGEIQHGLISIPGYEKA
jgi:phosphoribosylglycinamide formyltransferase-1